ncbi:MAG TPA: SDR family NAD(P)-dependent oxidoreductase [Pseudomonadales bacterium]
MNGLRKLAVVTGGSSGIGREISLTLARHGWDVALTWFHQGDAPDEVAGQIRRLGRRALASRCDAGVKAEVDSFFDAVAEHFGTVPDLLVNNAGVQTWAPLLDLEEAAWDTVMRTNLKGCFLNTQKLARMLVAAGKPGAIVNIGSGCSKVPFPNLVDYSTSKAAIDQFTRVAAIELGRHGIRVNCVAPGAIEIERTKRESPDYAGIWAAVTPLGRVGRAEDVANAVLFFAEAGSAFVTGQTLWVDGGAFTVPNWPYRTGR